MEKRKYYINGNKITLEFTSDIEELITVEEIYYDNEKFEQLSSALRDESPDKFFIDILQQKGKKEIFHKCFTITGLEKEEVIETLIIFFENKELYEISQSLLNLINK